MKLEQLVAGVGGLTFISRIFGYVRDIAIAFFLGAGVLNDAFIIALRLPNMFRTIFGEGAFSSAFIPLFASKLRTEGDAQAAKFARTVQMLLLISVTIFTIVMMLFMDKIVYILAYGYAHDPHVMDLATSLGRISFPYIIFISLMAFYGGISNSLRNYMPFASAPIILNIVLIAFVFLGDTDIEKVYWLTLSVPIAGVIEMLWVMYFVYRKFGPIKLMAPHIDEDTRTLFKRLVPGILSSGITQINVMVGTVIASFAAGGISYLYYADRIYQLPLAIIGTALSTIVLPELAKKYAKNELYKFNVLQNRALLFALYMTLPAAFLINALSTEIISTLFQYGAFTTEAAHQTAIALDVFSFGLPMYCYLKIFSSAFFASGDTKTPMRIAAISLVINIILSVILLPLFRHVAVALASVISSYFSVVVMGYILSNRGLYILYSQILNRILKILLASIVMFITVLMARHIFPIDNRIIALSVYLGLGGVSYLGLSFIFRAYPKRWLLSK